MTAQTITRGELREEFQGFRQELHRELQHYATKADLADLKAELIKWIVGMMFGAGVVAASLVTAVDRLLG